MIKGKEKKKYELIRMVLGEVLSIIRYRLTHLIERRWE